MKMRVLAFGELLWDLLPTGAVLGGAPFNFAYRLSSLGDEGLMVSRLGRDELGRKAWEAANSLGVDCSHIQWDESRPTGTVEVNLDSQGNPDFRIIPDVAYDSIEVTDAVLALARTAECVCFGTLIQRAPVSRETLRAVIASCPDSLKVLDLNLRKDCYSEDTIRESLSWADVVKLNEDELWHLGRLLGLPGASVPELSDELAQGQGMACCVVTLGEKGAYATSSTGERVYVPGFRVDVVDTCGSGDAFTAGFLHGLLRKQPLSECCLLGNVLGALVARQKGATGVVSWEDVRAFLGVAVPRVCDSKLTGYAGK